MQSKHKAITFPSFKAPVIFTAVSGLSLNETRSSLPVLQCTVHSMQQNTSSASGSLGNDIHYAWALPGTRSISVSHKLTVLRPTDLFWRNLSCRFHLPCLKAAIRNWPHRARPRGKSHGSSSWPSHPPVLGRQWPCWWSRALHPCTLKDASTRESLRCNPVMHSASLPFQNAELPVRALLGASVASTRTPTVTKGTAS